MKKLIYVGLLLAICSCKKPRCPEPTTADSTKTYRMTLQPASEGKDAHLSSLSPSQNSGTAEFLHASAWSVNGNLLLARGIIQFDYSLIPAGAKITKAR